MTSSQRSKSSRLRRPRKTVPAPRSGESTQGLIRIGEAARRVGVEAYVLRFWETQFPVLRPRHGRSKHRFYEPSDIETLKLIKRLLHEERFTIAGAKKHMKQMSLGRGGAAAKSATAAAPVREADGAPAKTMQRALAEIRRELQSLQKFLEG
jgi:DNA-binding transcriptional MerR regulator